MSHTLTSLISILHWSLPPNDEWTKFDGWSKDVLDNTTLWLDFITSDPDDILDAYNNPKNYDLADDAVVTEHRFYKSMLPLLRQGARQSMELRMHGYQRMYRFKGVKIIDAVIILRTMFPGKIGLSEAIEWVCIINDVVLGPWVEKPDGTKSRHVQTEDRPDKDAPWLAFVGNDDDLFELRRARSMGTRPINLIVESYDGSS